MAEGSIHPRELRSTGHERLTEEQLRRLSRHGGRDSSLSQLAITKLASECARRLAEADVHVEQTSDFDHAATIIEQLDKPYLTDYMSPMKNDFFESNCFWLILNDEHGQPGGMVGARFDDSGREPLSSFSERKIRNIFPNEANVPISPDRLPRLADEIAGRVVYTGDLYVNQGFRTTSRSVLRTVVLLLYTMVLLKWNDLDWIYAFMRDRDVRRGATWLYHFPRCYPMAHSWTKPPSDQTGENWLAAMSRLELMDLLSAYLAAPDRL